MTKLTNKKPQTLSFIVTAVLAAAGLGGLSSPASAAFVLIDDFESYTVGSTINGQGSWTSNNAANTVVADPAGGANKVLSFAAKDSSVFNSAAAISIANNTTGTLFFSFRMDTAASDVSTGLTDVNTPASFNDFRAQARTGNGSGKLDTRDGGAFRPLTTTGAAGGDEADNLEAWYHLWMVINNTSDTVEYWVQSDSDADFATQTQLFASETINFRTATTDVLDRLYLRSGTGNSVVYLDNFWIDTAGVNLTNPIPEPASLALLGLGGLLMLPRRRDAR